MASIVKHNVFKPVYYNEFHCIGAECEENCCNRTWEIHIDKKTYLEYRKAKKPEFREKIEKYVKRVRGDKADDNVYAEFVFDSSVGCPFQTAEGLCEIHKDLGEKYLCFTCFIYPRKPSRLSPDYVELSVTMSCPEAVRVALFTEEPMEFTVDTSGIYQNDRIVKFVNNAKEGETKTRYIEYGWDMRDASIDIIQDRSYPLTSRIFIVGMMLNRIVKQHDEGNADEIPASIEMYRQGTSGGAFRDVLGDIEPIDELQYKVASVLYFTSSNRSSLEKEQGTSGSVFTEMLNNFSQFISDLGMTAEESEGYDLTDYFFRFSRKKADEYWGEFLDDWEYVLENYFVNYIFSELFPLKYHVKGLNPYHHILMLAEQYALLKTLLCVNFDPDKGFSKPYITRTISHVAGVYQHSEEPFDVAELYKNAGLDGLPYLYQLLM